MVLLGLMGLHVEVLRFLTDFTRLVRCVSGCLIKCTEPIREGVLLFESSGGAKL